MGVREGPLRVFRLLALQAKQEPHQVLRILHTRFHPLSRSEGTENTDFVVQASTDLIAYERSKKKKRHGVRMVGRELLLSRSSV